MSHIEKVLGLATIGSTIASVSLIQRFVSGVTTVIILTVVSGTIAGFLAAGALYATEVILTHYNVDARAIFISIAAITFVTLTVLLGFMAWRLRELKELPAHLMSHHREAYAISRLGGLFNSFVDGFMDQRKKRKI